MLLNLIKLAMNTQQTKRKYNNDGSPYSPINPVSSNQSSSGMAANQAMMDSFNVDIPANLLNRPPAPRAPTAAEKAAAKKAAKLAARKKKGQAQRKKYEAAGTMAKKMKLLFT